MDLSPLLAITMGDAAGVGPEIVALALTQEIQQQYRPLIIGSVDVLAHAGQLVGSPLAWCKVSTPAEARFQPGTVDVLDLGNLTWDEVTPGVVCPAAGRAAAVEPMRSRLLDGDMAWEIYLSSIPKCFLKAFSAASLPRWMSFWLASLS
jgi:4-hydroxy-L-threonine phosphate dehydrogenase PdxA